MSVISKYWNQNDIGSSPDYLPCILNPLLHIELAHKLYSYVLPERLQQAINELTVQSLQTPGGPGRPGSPGSPGGPDATKEI